VANVELHTYYIREYLQLHMLFLLTKAQPKNALINPPKIGNDFIAFNSYTKIHCFLSLSLSLSLSRVCPLYVSYFLCCFTCLYFPFLKRAQPQSKCLLLFIKRKVDILQPDFSCGANRTNNHLHTTVSRRLCRVRSQTKGQVL
jgi:hypothetical protein